MELRESLTDFTVDEEYAIPECAYTFQFYGGVYTEVASERLLYSGDYFCNVFGIEAIFERNVAGYE